MYVDSVMGLAFTLLALPVAWLRQIANAAIHYQALCPFRLDRRP